MPLTQPAIASQLRHATYSAVTAPMTIAIGAASVASVAATPASSVARPAVPPRSVTRLVMPVSIVPKAMPTGTRAATRAAPPAMNVCIAGDSAENASSSGIRAVARTPPTLPLKSSSLLLKASSCAFVVCMSDAAAPPNLLLKISRISAALLPLMSVSVRYC